MIALESYGWNPFFEQQLNSLENPLMKDPALSVARVLTQFSGRYRVMSEGGELRAELSGRLRHNAEPGALPVVGDGCGSFATTIKSR